MNKQQSSPGRSPLMDNADRDIRFEQSSGGKLIVLDDLPETLRKQINTLSLLAVCVPNGESFIYHADYRSIVLRNSAADGSNIIRIARKFQTLSRTACSILSTSQKMILDYIKTQYARFKTDPLWNRISVLCMSVLILWVAPVMCGWRTIDKADLKDYFEITGIVITFLGAVRMGAGVILREG